MSAIFGVSPMPSHRMNSGTSARNGSVRNICIGASTMSSPSRDSPATIASAAPTDTPITSPASTRANDTPTLTARSPDSARS